MFLSTAGFHQDAMLPANLSSQFGSVSTRHQRASEPTYSNLWSPIYNRPGARSSRIPARG